MGAGWSVGRQTDWLAGMAFGTPGPNRRVGTFFGVFGVGEGGWMGKGIQERQAWGPCGQRTRDKSRCNEIQLSWYCGCHGGCLQDIILQNKRSGQVLIRKR